MSSESMVLGFIVIVLAVGYCSIMPTLAKDNIKRLFIVDGCMLVFVLITVGVKFSGKELPFSMLLFNTNWFVFSIVSYCVIESPVAIWYMKKHGVDIGK